MPCDGKNSNCQRRRELLSELKCLVASMDQKKPCEWDEPANNPPPTCGPTDASKREPPSNCIPVKESKSYEFRGGQIFKCECIKRNGLQDRCMFLDCMGRPECTTGLFPMCYPGRAALLKLTDLGDAQVALEKFYNADRARESALAAYCRLVCPENNNGTQCSPPLFISPQSSLTPHCGSAQSSSNQLHSQNYIPSTHHDTHKFHSSPTDSQVQQQLYRPQTQRCPYQPQYQQQQKPPSYFQRQYQQQPLQNCQQQYHQQPLQNFQQQYQQQPLPNCQQQYQQHLPQYCQQYQQQPMPHSYSSSQTSNMVYAQQC